MAIIQNNPTPIKDRILQLLDAGMTISMVAATLRKEGYTNRSGKPVSTSLVSSARYHMKKFGYKPGQGYSTPVNHRTAQRTKFSFETKELLEGIELILCLNISSDKKVHAITSLLS